MRTVYISEEEKKQIFDRILEVEKKVNIFIEEAQNKINKSTDKLNEFNARLLKLEKEAINDGK